MASKFICSSNKSLQNTNMLMENVNQLVLLQIQGENETDTGRGTPLSSGCSDRDCPSAESGFVSLGDPPEEFHTKDMNQQPMLTYHHSYQKVPGRFVGSGPATFTNWHMGYAFPAPPPYLNQGYRSSTTTNTTVTAISPVYQQNFGCVSSTPMAISSHQFVSSAVDAAGHRLTDWMGGALAYHQRQQQNDCFMSQQNLNEENRQEWLELLRDGKEEIPAPLWYTCHICYEKGHVIQNCPRKNEMASNTPYQGHRQCYGEFQCPKCKRRWTSRNSWSEQSQYCVKCKVAVFPRKQLSLKKAEQNGLLKPKLPTSGNQCFLVSQWDSTPDFQTGAYDGDNKFASSMDSDSQFSAFDNMGHWSDVSM